MEGAATGVTGLPLRIHPALVLLILVLVLKHLSSILLVQANLPCKFLIGLLELTLQDLHGFNLLGWLVGWVVLGEGDFRSHAGIQWHL